ncbi:MAG: NfeD family protein [Patescibacteria group bacterium]|nr:NfeD family protein [Patescibacteria group bacterium]
MFPFDNNYGVVYLGFFLIIFEILLGATTGFDLFLIGLILIISGFIGIFTKNFSYNLLSITVLSFLYIFLLRKLIKEKLTVETKNTNIDDLINKKGLVIKKITPHRAGQVKVSGEIWRAISEKEVEIGKEVVVKSISGVTLTVESL